jgi:glycosyltransferase involved in cell wall biosynthesis
MATEPASRDDSGEDPQVEVGDPGTADPQSTSDLEVLAVGTFGGGGIDHYVTQQVDHLSGYVAVDTHDMGMPPLEAGRTRVPLGIWRGLEGAARFVGRSPPDLVHVHASHCFSFYRAAGYVLFANRVWGVPVVLHVHGSSFDEFVATDSQAVATIQRRVFDASDRIVVLSEYWRKVLSLRADSEKVRVLPNAVDPETFPAKVPEDPHVVFVSNLVERKGVRELTAAVDRVAADRDDLSVSIAGDGPLSDPVERLAADHGNVEYLGYVSEDRKRSLLAEGSIYVLPTHAEGLPIAMLEGMAGGNAVVSTTVGSIPEVIGPDRGILVDPGDAEGLTGAIESLADAPERRASMAESNRAAIEDRYSWDHVRSKLLALYDELTGDAVALGGDRTP